MLAFNILRPGFWILAIEIRMGRAIDGCLAIDKLAERRRELLVCRVSTGPECVSSNCGDCIIMEMRDPSGLLFMDEIGMPTRCSSRPTKAGGGLSCLKCRPNHTYTRNTRNLRHLGLFEKNKTLELATCIKFRAVTEYIHELRSHQSTLQGLSVVVEKYPDPGRRQRFSPR
jgi:hypothetical protein